MFDFTNSPLLSQTTFKQSGTTRMTTTKNYDFLNRLTSISSVPSAAAASSFNYTYNAANQRVKSTLVDNSSWVYNYDSLGQVISGHKYFNDNTPVAGQQFDYTFDNTRPVRESSRYPDTEPLLSDSLRCVANYRVLSRGKANRTQTKTGGDQNGANQRTATYTPNSLNEYSQRTVPGDVDIKGISIATNTVTVAGLTANRKGEYFRQELGVNNSSAALWTNIVVAATGQTSASGNVFVAQTPESYTYDLDGNLQQDGRWTYAWDAENRLVAMAANTGVGPQISLKFDYDAQGRRICKQVWSNKTWSGSPTNDFRFVYDSWNLIGILNSSFSLLNSYVWGTDLSGSAQGAGGVGGLLEAVNYGVSTNFVAFDGNGNIAALVRTSDGTVTANYEYGPFGEVIRATGTMAKANPLRFSTKYQDDESDVVYYGYRYYNPNTGRWLSRDPVLEYAFEHVLFYSERRPTVAPAWKVTTLDLEFTFAANSSPNQIDLLGMCGYNCGKDVTVGLRRTQGIVRKGFNNLSYWKKLANCEPWVMMGRDPITGDPNPILLASSLSG